MTTQHAPGPANDEQTTDEHLTDRADLLARDEGAHEEKIGQQANFRPGDRPDDADAADHATDDAAGRRDGEASQD